MGNWKNWFGKYVFLKLRNGGYYEGTIIDVDDASPPLIFLTILDKFNKQITFVHSEIIKIAEKEEEGLK